MSVVTPDRFSRFELQALWSEGGANIDHPQIAAAIERGIPPMRGAAQRARLQEAPAQAQHPAVPGFIPFTHAAHEVLQPFGDQTFTPGANAAALGSPQNVVAYGYLRNIWILVEASGGTLGAGVLSADYPFNLLQTVQFTDVNGAPIFNPGGGYETLWSDILFGAAGSSVNDPRVYPWHVGTINAVFALRIPVEISHRDGFGSLANQNSAAAYQLNLSGNTSGNAYSTAPTTAPSVRVRAFAECWSIPGAVDVLRRPQAQMPPRLGTAQYTSNFIGDIQSGDNTLRLPRTGNLYRALAFISRTAAGARSDATFPDPLTYSWDARDIYKRMPQSYITAALMREKLPDLSARDTGVFAIPFNTSDHNTIGDDAPVFWNPTVQSSRIQIEGPAVTAGRLRVVTNDVAPVEVAPEERYVLASETGQVAEVGTPAIAAGAPVQ